MNNSTAMQAAAPEQAATAPPALGYDLPPQALPILPVHDLVLFPGVVHPIGIGREASVRAAQHAMRAERPIGVLLQRQPGPQLPDMDSMHAVGTSADIVRYATVADGNHVIICRGEKRFRVGKFLPGYPFAVAEVEWLDEPEDWDDQIEARFLQLKQRTLDTLDMLPQVSADLVAAVRQIKAPGGLADLVASVIDFKLSDQQRVLETVPLVARLDLALRLLAQRISVLQLAREIDTRTQATIDEHQREYFLREQLRSIRHELGEGEDAHSSDIAHLREQLEQAQLPAEAQQQAGRELDRLEHLPEAAAEYSMLRTYIECLLELPWHAPAPEHIDLRAARAVLDADHYGLEQIKKRIVEFLAVRQLNPDGHAPILCFVGPPGVGKTSLGQSIARALGRKFVRLSLGGVHDEAEIRGHRRTYVGALPGNILQSVRKAGSRGAVMMLDEIDKLGAGLHGDPAAALLEVLDPEQNHSFRDNYLAVPFDLSRMLFITTANVQDNIPAALLDRMETLELPGYTQEEKIEIARRYLVPRQLRENGLNTQQLTIADAALGAAIADYTREAGVRGLERQIAAICRHAAVRIADGTLTSLHVDAADLSALLGAPRHASEIALRAGLAGVATGLAWTPAGGDILFIEASRVPGSGKLILTGHLGDIMKESAQAALTLVRTRAAELGLDAAQFETSDVHVHVPAGAIPKDGPSAGVALFIALASLYSGRAARADTALTGEISLRGLVLPVGGIRDKVLAAMRAGIARVALPARNRRELDAVPEAARAR
ncbi:MAG: endopeptidase La, partial [Rhodocyclaceae bacterium]|nr:endopeptidase La [Rhodocyclaceae bacterium]